MLIRSLRIAAIGVITALAAGCATSSLGHYGLDADNALLVQHACSDIMGLRAGAEFEACTGSLAGSVLSMKEADVLARADQFCTGQGMERGTSELAKCTVSFKWQAMQAATSSLEASGAGPSEARTNASVSQADELPRKYYHHMTHSEQDHRAELSCAQLGLHPAWESFRQCVSNLKFSLVDVRFATQH